MGQLQRKIGEREKRLYREVKAMNPKLYEKAVRIGSLVTCSGGKSKPAIAAKVEAAVMSLILELS